MPQNTAQPEHSASNRLCQQTEGPVFGIAKQASALKWREKTMKSQSRPGMGRLFR